MLEKEASREVGRAKGEGEKEGARERVELDLSRDRRRKELPALSILSELLFRGSGSTRLGVPIC